MKKSQLNFHHAGGQITFEEFIEYKRKQFGRQVTDEEHKQIDLEFRLVDTDGSGTIDWWEFLNFQARVKLASRDPVCVSAPSVGCDTNAMLTSRSTWVKHILKLHCIFTFE